MREYELIADWYARERTDASVDASGVPEVMALAASIHRGGRVLDIGCGHGAPLTKALLASGHRVVGLDSASNMLRRFRANCPDAPAVKGIAQDPPFVGETCDAAIAWGVLFHLKPAEQVHGIANIARVLKTGAPFLFTAGYPDAVHKSGDQVGTMNGVEFHYYSFTIDGYRDVLGDHGFALVNFHTDKGENGCYLAHRIG